MEEEIQLAAQEEGYETTEEEEPTLEIGKIAILLGGPRFHTLRLKGNIQGQKVTVLVDRGATHNFIDEGLLERRNLQDQPFNGFIVIIPGNNSMDCTKWIPKLQVTIGNHTITDKFYAVNVDDTNAVLGVQWSYSLGEHTMKNQFPEMRFKNSDGKPILLRGMHT